MSCEQTAAFYEALGAVEDLDSEIVPASMDTVEAYATAVRSLVTAWRRADEHALRVGVGNLDPVKRRTLTRARQALDLALSDTTGVHERAAALALAKRLLAELHIELTPEAAGKLQASIEHTHRRQITRGPQFPASQKPGDGRSTSGPSTGNSSTGKRGPDNDSQHPWWGAASTDGGGGSSNDNGGSSFDGGGSSACDGGGGGGF